MKAFLPGTFLPGQKERSSTGSFALALSVLAFSALALGACDSTSSTLRDDPVAEAAGTSVTTGANDRGDLGALITGATEGADLSPTQVEAVQSLAADYAGRSLSRAALWTAAAGLQPVLEERQVQQLGQAAKAKRAERRKRGRHGQRGERGRRGKFHRARLRGIDLTDEQKTTLREALGGLRRQMAPLVEARRQGTLSEAETAELRSLHEQMRAAWQDILTEEQRRQLKEGHAERKTARQAVKKARETALGFTEEQKTQLTALRKERVRRGAYTSVLTDEQRQVITLHRLLGWQARQMYAAAHRR